MVEDLFALGERFSSSNRGTYTFPVLPVGHYQLEVRATGFRGDQQIRKQSVSRQPLRLPAQHGYPTAQSGASVPGFNALTTGSAQLIALGDTKTLGSAAVNEFHLSCMRDFNDLGQPVGGRGVTRALCPSVLNGVELISLATNQ